MPLASRALLYRAQRALGLTQVALAERLGSSKRTGQRWAAGEASPYDSQWKTLAAMVYPIDPALAREIAREGRTTPEELGIVPPPPAPPPAPAPLAATLLVDSVVCAAVSASMLPPQALRPVLLAAFARARELRMDVATVEAALREPSG